MPTLAVCLACLLAVAALSLTAHGNEVFGCGGFIQLSEAMKGVSKRPDLARITVQLLTADGVKITAVRASPNGYYFIPLESALHTSYRLAVDAPAGWSVAPLAKDTLVTVSEVGDRTVCNNGQDVNFRFAGFTLSGRVVGSRDCDGPQPRGRAGVRIVLTSASGVSSFAGSGIAVSDANGAFVFETVAPGSFVLTASHESWTLALSSVSVDMEAAPHELASPFVVSGYDVAGSVVSGSEGVSGITVYLFSASVTGAIDCERPTSLPEGLDAGAGARALCIGSTDSAGRFVFRGLPCGEYSVMPIHRSAAATFEVAPSRAAFTIANGSHRFAAPFTVQGFSVSGRVVTASGRGVGGVTVQADGGRLRAVSGADGSYTLTKLSAGTIELSATKDHVFFASLPAVRVSPALGRLPDILVTGYHICGSVSLSSPSAFALADQSVVLATEDGEVIERRKLGARDGGFCFEATVGTYVVSVRVAPRDAARGLVIAPADRTVTLTAEPFLAADFAQSRVAVSGRVHCLAGACALAGGAPLSVSLTPVGASAGGAVLSTAVAAKTGTFSFPDVPAGEFALAAVGRDWCWEPASPATVSVAGADVSGLRLAQRGYRFAVTASHVLDLAVSLAGDAAAAGSAVPSTIALVAGDNSVCLPAAGRYTFAVPASACFDFRATPALAFDTAAASAATPVTIAASAARVRGAVDVVLSQLPADSSPPAAVSVTATAADGTARTLSATPAASAAGVPAGIRRYLFTDSLAAGQSATYTPRAAALLFRPASRSATGSLSGCLPALEPLVSERGVFLSGTVTPPERGTHILVFDPAASEAVPLLTVETDAAGAYTAGPLHGGIEYRLAARREGFHFKQLERGHFKAVRLGGLSASVRTASGAAVEGALLSLSGEDYRSNMATGADGAMAFEAIMPGEYYLRPMLREFVFAPDAASVNVAEGKVQSVSFVATRVAWSVTGRARSLNGQPEKGLTVEARGSDGASDSTLTDATGAFRLRGFADGTTVSVSVRTGAGLAAAVPASRSVVMTAADATGLAFVATRVPARIAISGAVTVATPAHLATLTVELVGSDGAVFASRPAAPLGFFSFDRLAVAAYTVRLRTTLAAYEYEYAPVSRALSKDQALNSSVAGARYVMPLHFAARLKQDTADISNVPFALFSLVLIAAVVALYRNELRQYYADVTQAPRASTGFEPVPQGGSRKSKKRE